MNERAWAHAVKYVSFGVGLSLMLALLWPGRAWACACCSDEGTWFEMTDRISDYEMAELNNIRFDVTAHTYMTEAGEDGLEGISNPAEEYRVTLSKRRGRWQFSFRDKEGHTGTLSFTVPSSLTDFAADIHDGQQSAGGGPLLYKEWRLVGPLSGTGIFKRGITSQTRFRLIFQGRGNACTSAETFGRWQLQVFGPQASYSFYGALKNSGSQSAADSQ